MSQQPCAAPEVFQNLRLILVIDALISIIWTMPDPSEFGGGQVSFGMGEWTRHHNAGTDQSVETFYNIRLPFSSEHRAAESWKKVMEVTKNDMTSPW